MTTNTFFDTFFSSFAYLHALFFAGGRGLGSLFGTLLRGVLPAAKAVGRAAVHASKSSLGKEVKRGLKQAALDSMLDVIEGEDPRDVAQKQMKKAATSVLKRAKNKPDKRRQSQAKKRRRRRPVRPLYDEDDEFD